MQTLKVTTAPVYEPVSLAEAKRWLVIDSDITDHDADVRLLIKAMREDAENLTGRAFIQRSLRLTMEGWPLDPKWGVKIVLPQPPLVEVTSVKYIDTNGVQQTLAADQYVVHDDYEPAFIVPAWSVSFPTARIVPNAIEVNYVAGYPVGSPSEEASAQENVPQNLKLWMKTKIATLFENREQIISGTIVAKIPRDFTDGLLDPLLLGRRLF